MKLEKIANLYLGLQYINLFILLGEFIQQLLEQRWNSSKNALGENNGFPVKKKNDVKTLTWSLSSEPSKSSAGGKEEFVMFFKEKVKVQEM